MTIAIVISLNESIVLASDSATSIRVRNPEGGIGISQIYENANKIFNLIKSLPIGLIAWGTGNIGEYSIEALAKKFRREFTERYIKD